MTPWSDTEIVVTVPDGILGSQPVTVTTAGGVSNAAPFVVTLVTGPEISSISPSSGYQGTWVTITGSGFGIEPGPTATISKVYFGTQQALTTKQWGANSIKAMVPTTVSGSAAVKVVVGGVESNSVAFIATALSTYNVDAYGAVGNGTTDDTTAIRNTWNAVRAAGRGNMTFTAGKTYRITGNPIALDAIRTNDWLGATAYTTQRSGTIVITGNNAIIKYDSTDTNRFGLLFNQYSPPAWYTYGNVVLQNIRINDNGRSPSAEVGSICWIREACNASNFVFKNVTEYGAPDMVIPPTGTVTGTQAGIYFKMGPSNADGVPAHFNYCSGMVVDGCTIKAHHKPIAFLDDSYAVAGGGYGCDSILFDDITVQSTSTDGSNSRGTGLLHVGQYGYVGSVTVLNCSGRRSADNMIEVDQTLSMTVRHTSFSEVSSGFGYAIFGPTYNSGVPTITLDDVHHTGGPNLTPWVPQLTCYGSLAGGYNPYDRSDTLGHWTLSDCSQTQTVYDRSFYPNFYSTNPLHFDSLTITNFSNTDNFIIASRALFEFRQRGTSCPLTISDLTMHVTGSGATSENLFIVGGNVVLDIDGVTVTADNFAGNYFSHQQTTAGTACSQTGTIRAITAAATTQTNTHAVTNNSGVTANFTVRDCDFSLMKTGTDVVVNSGSGTITETSNLAPAG